MAKTGVNPFDELTFQEIYDDIKSRGYIERIYEGMTTRLKNMKSYKNMMEVAEQNIYNTNFDTPMQDVKSKKKKIKEIGLLASEFDYSISTLISKTIEHDAKFSVETFIKRLSTFKQMTASEMSSPAKKAIKRPANNSPKKTENRKHFKDNFENRRSRKRLSIDNSDNEVGSSGSVSSVHTSELSSFEDEIVIPPEDKTNGKNQMIISFKAVNQAYKSMMSTKKKEPKHRGSIQKKKEHKHRGSIQKKEEPKHRGSIQKFSRKKSNGAVRTESPKQLPKRTPKPNSRYFS